jgi:hypothetical protein
VIFEFSGFSVRLFRPGEALLLLEDNHPGDCFIDIDVDEFQRFLSLLILNNFYLIVLLQLLFHVLDVAAVHH